MDEEQYCDSFVPVTVTKRDHYYWYQAFIEEAFYCCPLLTLFPVVLGKSSKACEP
jgi:hypothetical protein